MLKLRSGNGIRVEKGGETFAQWPGFKEHPELPRAPRPAIELLTRYFRYCANLARLGQERRSVGCIVKAANLVAPAAPGAINYDLNALALLMREWSSENLLSEHSLVSCLLTENLLDLHPLLATNPRAAKIQGAAARPRRHHARARSPRPQKRGSGSRVSP